MNSFRKNTVIYITVSYQEKKKYSDWLYIWRVGFLNSNLVKAKKKKSIFEQSSNFLWEMENRSWRDWWSFRCRQTYLQPSKAAKISNRHASERSSTKSTHWGTFIDSGWRTSVQGSGHDDAFNTTVTLWIAAAAWRLSN